MNKKAILSFIRRYGLFVLLSFLMPLGIMVVVYYQNGIYLGSESTVMASDSFVQYSNFHASFHNVLHGKQNIFYTWSGSLGLNYWSLMAYYLNGIFTPLVALFDNLNMPDTFYFLTLLKIGVSGISFWIYAHNTYRLPRWVIVGLSTAYALMSYSVSYSEVIMWLDTFMYVPLILLGINRVMDQRKPGLLFISYLLIFVSNFYMAFMVGVFSFLYFVARLLTDWKRYKSRIGDYLLTSFLAGGASMITILPTILDLRANGESLTPITQLITPDVGPWDLVAKSMVGVYDTSQYESMAFIYIGLLPLIFCIFYFFVCKTNWLERISYGGLMLILVVSVYIYPLNLFWHGLHSPNMFLFRFSFLISVLVIVLAGYGLERFNTETSNTFVNTVFGIGLVFFLFLIFSNKKRYGIITTETVIMTFSFLVLYLAIGLLWNRRGKHQQWLAILLFLLMSGEAFVNTGAMVKGISRDWGYPSREFYTTNHKDIKALTEVAEEQETSFFRMENLDPISINDSFNFGYHGVSMFSSIRNRHSSQYVNALGFRSLGTNLQVQYANNTLLADSLVGVKYNLANGDVQKFGYTKVASKGKFTLYENQYALPLGILTDDGIYEEDQLKNQSEIFHYLSKSDEELFTVREATIASSEHAILTETDETIEIAEIEPNQPKSVTWMVTVPAKTQGYLSLVPTDLSITGGMSAVVTVDGVTRKAALSDAGQYYSLGYHEKTTTVEVTAVFPRGRQEQQQVTLYRPDALFLNTEKFADTVEKIKENGIEFETSGSKATASVNSTKEQVLLTTIPYDKGWKVYIDGKKAEIVSFKDAFLTVRIPAGSHEITFAFLPQGFVVGSILFGSCIFIFFGYLYWLKKRQSRSIIESGEEE